MAEEGKKTVTFQYKVSPNYRLYSIGGVHGGLNAGGEIVVNLFSERQSIPRRVTYELTEKGGLAESPIETDQTTDIIRNVNFGISIKPQFARSFAQWLNEKADEYDRLRKENLLAKDEGNE